MDQMYLAQAGLLLQCLPAINKQTDFALKGGTAINLFVLDMPRLSVDIDLTWLPVGPRQQTLEQIDQGQTKISCRGEVCAGKTELRAYPCLQQYILFILRDYPDYDIKTRLCCAIRRIAQ